MRRALAVLALVGIAALAAAQPVTVLNGGFEEELSTGPRGWSFDHWQKTGGAEGRVDGVAHTGKRSALLDGKSEDDSRFVQIVTVKPETWYHVSAWIKTQNVDPSQVGAHVSVLGAQQAVGDLRGSQDWTKVELALHTAPHQNELTLALRLGFYGATTTGRAWFDDVAIEEVQNAGALAVLDLSPARFARPNPDFFGWAETLAAGLLSALVWWLARRLPEPRRWAVVAVITVVTVCKLVLAALSSGYPADVATFSAWASDVFRLGPAGFYRDGYFADYPPGYLYVLWLVGGFSALFHIDSSSTLFLVLLKLPAVLADVAGAVVLWKLGRENPRSVLVPLLWLLSPLAALDSSVWGQVDSVFSLALLAAFGLLEFRRLGSAAVLFVVAVLLKPQALLAAPLALLWLAAQRPPLRTLIRPLMAAVVAALVLIVPFAWNKSPLWIFELYAQTLSSYNYAGLNAANLWYLVGLNWADASAGWGLSWNVWGWLVTGAAALCVCWGVWKSRLPGRWLFGAFGLFVVVFAFSTHMHERYLFPAALLGLGAYQLLRDPRVLWAAVAAGLIGFADVLVTWQTMLAGSSAVASGQPVMVLASMAMLLLAGWTVYLSFDLLAKGRVYAGKPQPPLALRPKEATSPSPESSTPRWKPALAVGVLTTAYAVAALWNLGGTAPQRFWEPRNPGESATFDLGSLKSLKAVEYHLGLGTGEFSLEYSSDRLGWKQGQSIVNDNPFTEFRWRTLLDSENARFVRVTLVRGRQQLNELALVDTAGAFVEPRSPTSPLFDEPHTRVSVSDSTNGMYFDEVYFARSGWEILQGREASENTHPPLGKVILAGSIALFGMNPVAWRLPGTLFGIAMIPLMYLLAFRLFGSRRWGFLASLFLAVDFMHFTQTRIGTVDGYVMLFVLGAYYALVRWYQDSHAQKGRPGWSLLLSGVFISLAIATKWIGLYAAAGLAALFVAGCFGLGKSWFHKRGATTLGVCVIAFAVLPLTVYIASYVPQMQASHAGFQAIVDNQISMWNYHSQMKQTHPFSSPWYQWPLMIKPMWYYSGSASLGPDTVSTIIAFGNPVVWWLGSAAFVYVLVRLFRRPRDIASWFIVLAGLAQYLPWAVIPRKLVFIYHFFMTVPFLVLALTLALRDWSQRLGARRHWPVWTAAGGAVVLFVIYFPVLGGTPVPRWWAVGLQSLGIPIYF